MRFACENWGEGERNWEKNSNVKTMKNRNLQTADGVLLGGDVKLKSDLRHGFERYFKGSLPTTDAADSPRR